MIDGVSLYKIDLPHALVRYFDKNDYRPLYLDDPTSDGLVRLRVAAFEHLPLPPPIRIAEPRRATSQRPRRYEPTERPEQVALAPLQLDTVARVALPPKGD